MQRIDKIQYIFYNRRILKYDVFITNKNTIYAVIWTILVTLYHAERMFLETRGWDNNS